MATNLENGNEVISDSRGDESQGLEQLSVKVNGVEIEVAERVLVRDLIVEAKGKGAIAGSVDEYVIERIAQEGEFGAHETIRVSEHEEFLAVPVAGTPVA